jgi:streptogramin lyase
MIGNYSARLSGSKRNLIALLASSAVLTVGCSNMVSTAPSSNPLSKPASLSGKVHGGNQQVVGATVTLWYAGQGSSAPPTLAATTTTDSGGFFSFIKDTVNGNTADNGSTSTFSCHSGTDPLTYVMSKGGNTQNNGNATQSNTAAAFLGIYGVCSQLSASNFIDLSEVTTVATMAAASQFFNPFNDTISAVGTGQEKIVIDEVPATAALLANMTTGLYVPSTTISPAAGGNVAPGVTVTATAEPGKVNLIANIISACINSTDSSSTPCTTLFTSTPPPIGNTTYLNPGTAFPAATDTLQALFYLFTNPSNSPAAGSSGTTNLAALFSLAGGVGAPYQPSAAQPTDWTIAINFVGDGACGTPTAGTGDFINSPVDIGIDGSNAVWFANSQTGGNLSAITSSGQPLACIHMDAGSSNAGGVLDSSGNIWFAGGTTMYRYNQNSKQTFSFPAGVTPLAIAADGLGNVYFTAESAGVGSLYQLTGAATASSVVFPLQISNTLGPNPVRIMPDFKSTTALGNIWVSSGSTFVSKVTAGTGTGNLNGFVTTSIPAVSSGSTYGIAVDQFNAIATSTSDTNEANILVFDGTSSWVSLGGGWPYSASTAGIASPTGISVDGRGSVIFPNSGNPSFSELSLFGANHLSPATAFQETSADLNNNKASIVDQAGNIWIVGSGNNFVTEILGNAVPIFQPYAVGLAVGRFQQLP